MVLRWEYLSEMLTQVVIPNAYNAEAYKERYESVKDPETDPKKRKDWGIAGKVQYTWRDGALHEDLPIWCAYDCKRKWGPGLGIAVPPAPPAPPARPPPPLPPPGPDAAAGRL